MADSLADSQISPSVFPKYIEKVNGTSKKDLVPPPSALYIAEKKVQLRIFVNMYRECTYLFSDFGQLFF
jgi:hypothetical protein